MKTFKQHYNNIQEVQEQYKEIKEKRPIHVNIIKRPKGQLLIKVPPMTMSYETWQKLDHGHLHPFGHDDYSDDRIGVAGSSYNYKDGSAEFKVRSKEDLKKWLKYPKYKGIIKI